MKLLHALLAVCLVWFLAHIIFQLPSGIERIEARAAR